MSSLIIISKCLDLPDVPALLPRISARWQESSTLSLALASAVDYFQEMEQKPGGLTTEQHRRATFSTVPRAIFAALLLVGLFAAFAYAELRLDGVTSLLFMACVAYLGTTAMATILYLLLDARGSPFHFFAPGERLVREVFVKDDPFFRRFVLREVIR